MDNPVFTLTSADIDLKWIFILELNSTVCACIWRAWGIQEHKQYQVEVASFYNGEDMNMWIRKLCPI